jgi:hypothetical protein
VVITDGQMRVAPGKPVSVKNGKHGGNRHKA